MTLRASRKPASLGSSAVVLLSTLLFANVLWAADDTPADKPAAAAAADAAGAPEAAAPEAAAPEAAAPAAATAAATATAPVATTELPKVTVKFEKASISDVALQLHEMTGYDFVVGRGVQGEVTASFTDSPLDKVLNTLGAVLGLTVDRHEKMFVIKTKQAPEAMAGPLTGAGALLPGEAPVTPLKEAGADLGQLGNTTAPDPAATGTQPGRRVTEQIPLNAMKPQVAAGMFGAPWIDAQGNAHTPQEALYNQWLAQQWQQQMEQSRPPVWADPGWNNQAWPNGNLPAGSTIGPAGNITLPNGTVIGRNGQVTFPDGSVRLPNGQTVLPNGTVLNPGTYRPNNRPVAGGNIGGVPFQVNPDGGVTIAPGGMNLGGLGSVYMPGLNIGGNGRNNTMGNLNNLGSLDRKSVV
mgnify:FL=1